MNENRTASFIALFSAPVAYLLSRVATSPIFGLVVIALVLGGFILGIVIGIRAHKEGDTGSRNRASMGAFLCALYLGLILYMAIILVPRLQKEALEIQQQAQQKEAAAASSATPVAASPTPAQ